MKFWVDAQLPPSLALWLSETFQVEAVSLRDIGLRDSKDKEIFDSAKLQDIVVISKDSDFLDLITRLGSPPRLLWVTCGNVTNRKLREHFWSSFPKALQMLKDGESIVEIGATR
ncbi:MAG: DUF5615 family PIN-like protein [Candidatus Ozemobacteraceae bacterium]